MMGWSCTLDELHPIAYWPNPKPPDARKVLLDRRKKRCGLNLRERYTVEIGFFGWRQTDQPSVAIARKLEPEHVAAHAATQALVSRFQPYRTRAH